MYSYVGRPAIMTSANSSHDVHEVYTCSMLHINRTHRMQFHVERMRCLTSRIPCVFWHWIVGYNCRYRYRCNVLPDESATMHGLVTNACICQVAYSNDYEQLSTLQFKLGCCTACSPLMFACQYGCSTRRVPSCLAAACN